MNVRTIQAILARYTLQDDQFALRLLNRWLFKPLAKEKVAKILVHRAGQAWDMAIIIPVLALLRSTFPQAHISLLTSIEPIQGSNSSDSNTIPKALLEAFPQLVNQCIQYVPQETKSWCGLKALKSRIREQGPIDLWISLPTLMHTFHSNLAEMLMVRWLGCPYAAGFSLLLPDIFQTTYARYYKDLLPKAADWLYSNLAPIFATQSDANANLHLYYFQPPIPWQPTDWDVNPDLPILAVCAGANLPIQQWPAAYFQKVLQQLSAQFPTLQIILLGNHHEKAQNAEIKESLSGTVLNLSGQLSPSQTWSLLSQATAVFSNETEIMHMAGLLQKTVFSPMSGQYPPPVAHPPGKALVEFHRPVPCAPCFEKQCPLKEQICMTLLTPELVFPSMIEALSTLKP